MILYWNDRKYVVNSISKEKWEIKNKTVIVFNCRLIVSKSNVSDLASTVSIVTDEMEYGSRELDYLINGLSGLDRNTNEVTNHSAVKLRQNGYNEVIMDVELEDPKSDLTTKFEIVFPASEIKIM